MKRKVSFSIGRLQVLYGDERALEIAKEIGADAVDFNLCGKRWDYQNPESIYSKSDDEIIAYYTKLREKAENLGIEIAQTHGRIEGFKNIPEEDEALIKNARIDCLVTKTLGAPVCVMHGVTTIFLGPDADPELYRDLNFTMFNRIIPFAKQYGIKIATETFGDAKGGGEGGYHCCDFFGNAKEFIDTYNRICAEGDNADYFTVCVDTGHSNKATRFDNPSAADVIRMNGKNISVLHLNDNDTITDQHKAPMTGCIDWNDVFDALDEVGYNGIYNMELQLAHFGKGFEIETAEFGIKVLKHMLKTRYGDE